MDTYNSFIASKAITVEAKGFKVDISELNPMLFDFQKDIVRWLLQRVKRQYLLIVAMARLRCNSNGRNRYGRGREQKYS